MESAALHALLHQLLAAWENEVVEFKEASKDYKTAEIFQYFSALSNEANLRGANSAWLVFGVRNKDKQIVGTDFRLQHDHLHSLKQQVKQSTGSISFREIHELMVDGKRGPPVRNPPGSAWYAGVCQRTCLCTGRRKSERSGYVPAGHHTQPDTC